MEAIGFSLYTAQSASTLAIDCDPVDVVELCLKSEEEEDKLYWRGPTIGTTSLLRTNM